MHNRIHRHSRKFRACKLILFLCAGLISGNAWTENADRLLRKAGRYFSALPAQMPGAENDTPQLMVWTHPTKNMASNAPRWKCINTIDNSERVRNEC